MTTGKLEEAARQLLEVAAGIQHGTDWNNGTHAKIYRPKFPAAITALREALDQQADQEPVACVKCNAEVPLYKNGMCEVCDFGSNQAEQKPVALDKIRRIVAEYIEPNSQVDSGNLFWALCGALQYIDVELEFNEPTHHVQQKPVAWRDHVEQRLLTWRQSFVNRSGDQLALDDFMDKQSLDDLIDFVCDEYSDPKPEHDYKRLYEVAAEKYNALSELMEKKSEQEPVIRATLAPPAPPEVYQMRSKEAYEAGWWEAQRQKAVSPIAPVQQAEQEPVACIVRDCCEAEKADPDHSDTICIAVDDLTEIVTHHTTAPVQQAEQEHIANADKMVCNWRQPTYSDAEWNAWQADCDQYWAITEGTPTENGIKFCYGCGKPIKEHPFVDSEDE